MSRRFDDSIFLALTAFAGLRFASTASIPGMGGGDAGAGAGGGEGGGAGDAGGGGDEGAGDGDLGDGDDGAGDDGDAAIEGDEDGAQVNDTDRQGRDRAGKGAATPEQRQKEIETGLTELKKTNPKLAGELRSELFQTKQFRDQFATPKLAAQAKETLDDLGGYAGISKMQTEVNSYANELAAFSEGNPEAVERFANDYPEGLVKLTPLAVAKMKQLDAKGFERMLSREMAGMMEQRKFTHYHDRLIELLQDGKVDQAAGLAGELRSWIDSVEKFGKSEPAAEGRSKVEADKLAAKAATVAKAEQAVKIEKASIRVTNSINGHISRVMNPQIKGRNLSTAQKAHLEKTTWDTISDILGGQKDYQAKLKQLVDTGDENRIDRYVSSKVKEIAGRAFKIAYGKSGFSRSGGAKRAGAAAGAGGAGATVTELAKKPSYDEIDWSKDRGRSRFMRGEATLKNGKVVKFKF